jgi:hypothetical protein
MAIFGTHFYIFSEGRMGEGGQPRISYFRAYRAKKEPAAIFSQLAFENSQNSTRYL